MTLREMRELRGVKQSAVAEAVGVTRQTYAKYEAEPRTMPLGKAEDVCAFLHCDIADIFFGSSESLTNGKGADGEE